MGMAYFQEYSTFTALYLSFFCMGVAVTLLGILLLSQRSSFSTHTDSCSVLIIPEQNVRDYRSLHASNHSSKY